MLNKYNILTSENKIKMIDLKWLIDASKFIEV